jgi:hypothetical protein
VTKATKGTLVGTRYLSLQRRANQMGRPTDELIGHMPWHASWIDARIEGGLSTVVSRLLGAPRRLEGTPTTSCPCQKRRKSSTATSRQFHTSPM